MKDSDLEKSELIDMALLRYVSGGDIGFPTFPDPIIEMPDMPMCEIGGVPFCSTGGNPRSPRP